MKNQNPFFNSVKPVHPFLLLRSWLLYFKASVHLWGFLKMILNLQQWYFTKGKNMARLDLIIDKCKPQSAGDFQPVKGGCDVGTWLNVGRCTALLQFFISGYLDIFFISKDFPAFCKPGHFPAFCKPRHLPNSWNPLTSWFMEIWTFSWFLKLCACSILLSTLVDISVSTRIDSRGRISTTTHRAYIYTVVWNSSVSRW